MWFSRDYEEAKAPKESAPSQDASKEDLVSEKTFSIRFKFLDSNNIGLELFKPPAPQRRTSFFNRKKEEPEEKEGEEMPDFNSSVLVSLHQSPMTVPDIILCAQENENVKELTILRCSLLPKFDVKIFKEIMGICGSKGSFEEYVKNSSGEGTLKIFLIGVIFQVNPHQPSPIIHPQRATAFILLCVSSKC